MSQQALTWITSVLENFIFAGAFFGWANIYPVLRDEQYFTDSCASSQENGTEPCNSQEESLSFVYAISSSVGVFLSVFIGVLFDVLGMWCSRTVLINIAAASYLMVALSSLNSSYLLYIAFPVINTAGFGLMLTNAQTANLFPKLRSLYSMSVTGGFNSASVLYLFINRMYYTGFGFHSVVSSYAFAYFTLNLRTFLLTPKQRIPGVLPANYVYGYKELSCAGNNNSATDTVKEEEEMNEGNDVIKSVAVDPDKRTVKEVLREVYIYTGVLALVITQFVTNFYISTLNMFLETLLHSHSQDDINYYTTIFGVLQCCSIVVSPINGMIIEYFRQRFRKTCKNDYFASIRAYAIGFLMGNFCLILMVTFTLIPVASVQIIAMVMQILCKIFFFGVWDAFCTLVLPSQHFGKLYGLALLVNGLFLLLQYPLTLILTRVLDYNFTAVNSGLLIVSCFSIVHPIYLLYYCRIQQKSQKEQLGFHDNPVSIEDES